MNINSLRVGLCGIGLDAYWPQFDGLKSRLEGYLNRVSNIISGAGAEVVALGLVDDLKSSREAGRAAAATSRRNRHPLSLRHVTTYAVSSTVLPHSHNAQACQSVVLNLQPRSSHRFTEAFAKLSNRTAMTGHWLEYCSKPAPSPKSPTLLFARANLPTSIRSHLPAISAKIT